MILFYLFARMPGAQLLCLLAIDILFLFLNLCITARACFLGTISQKVGFEIVLPLLLWVMRVSVERCLSTPVIFGFLPCSLEISGVSWPLGSLPSSSVPALHTGGHLIPLGCGPLDLSMPVWLPRLVIMSDRPQAVHMSLCCNYKLGKEIRSDTDFHSEDLWTGESRDKFKVWGVQESLSIMPKCVFMHFSGHEGP